MSNTNVTFSSDFSEEESISISGDGLLWSTQANLFFRFLLAQGFIVSEKLIGEYYLERAKEVLDTRSNSYNPPIQLTEVLL